MKKIKSKEGLKYIEKAIQKANINDPVEVAQLLAQLGHESMGFTRLEEIASGRAYEGRKDLGNVIAGDGERFKGRGFIQLTGRSNYRHFGQIVRIDLERYPHLAADPIVAADVAIAYWNSRVKPRVKNFSNTRAVTRLINGGYNGLKDRIRRFNKQMDEIKGNEGLLARLCKSKNEISISI